MAQPFSDAFYHSRIWKKQRLHALHRDGYSCVDCGGHADEVHHIVELTALNIYDYEIALSLDNLVSLCRKCHKARHGDSSELPEGYRFDADGQVVPGQAVPG